MDVVSRMVILSAFAAGGYAGGQRPPVPSNLDRTQTSKMPDTSRKCGCCGLPLDSIPFDIAFPYPVPYYGVPEGEREKRVQLASKSGSADWAIIDGFPSAFPKGTKHPSRLHLIRGVMLVPLKDRPGESFGWGLWVEVAEADFKRYYELKKVKKVDALKEAPFRGLLRTWPRNYPEFASDEVMVYLGKATARPEFRPTTFDDRMYQEHRDGITVARWHQIVRELLPTK
jgi:hypothetical protein